MHFTPPEAQPFAGCRTAASQRRRSGSRLLVFLFGLAAACQADDPTGADLTTAAAEPVDATTTGTDLNSDVAPSFAVSTALTNQPSGFSRIAEWAASSMMPLSTYATSGYGVLSGKWARWYKSSGTSGKSDASAPKTSSGTLQFTWPAGLSPGTAAGGVTGWATTDGTEYSKIYESGWVKIPSSSFEVHGPSLGLKMFGFWAVGNKQNSGGANQLIGWTQATTNPATKLRFVLMQQNFITRNLWPNVNTGYLFIPGTWHRYEILMEINSIGSANGKFQMWWNGTKTHNYTNVTYRTSTYPAKFFARKWIPIWGGAGGPNKSRTDNLLVDHIYISGVK
jgi:hypothetical protein